MKEERGITLIEILIGILLISLAWLLVVGILGNQISALQTLTRKMDVETNVRHTMIILEKQIENSDCIIYQDNRIYLRDLESSAYLDYYNMEGINLYKNKVYDNLKSIGLGAKSQIASNITFFSFEPVGSNGAIELTIESMWGEQVYRISKVLAPTCPIYVIG